MTLIKIVEPTENDSGRHVICPNGADGVIAKPYTMIDFMLRIISIIQENTKVEVKAMNGLPEENSFNRKILIMEDDPGLSRIYSKALKKSGFDVYLASTLEEARQLIERLIFNIFICDIRYA